MRRWLENLIYALMYWWTEMEVGLARTARKRKHGYSFEGHYAIVDPRDKSLYMLFTNKDDVYGHLSQNFGVEPSELDIHKAEVRIFEKLPNPWAKEK